MARKKIQRESKRTTAGENALEKALRCLESAEISIREGRSLIHVAGKRQNVPALQYLNAARAINTMAAKPCEVGLWAQGHKICNDAIEAGDAAVNDRCWPCFARHVKNGGTP